MFKKTCSILICSLLLFNFSSYAQFDSTILSKSLNLIGVDKNGYAVSSGTGFILKYEQQYFLITNYHVLTGKLPDSRQKDPGLRDTCSMIAIKYRSQSNDTVFNNKLIKLYDSRGNRNYSVYHYINDTLLDIAVMPLKMVNFSSLNDTNLAITHYDTTLKNKNNISFHVVGFAKGKYINGWQPVVYESTSIGYDNYPKSVWNPYLLFNKRTEFGMSGSPIYIKNKETNQYILVGVNSLGFTNNQQPQGIGVNIKEVLQVLDEMILKGRPDVNLF